MLISRSFTLQYYNFFVIRFFIVATSFVFLRHCYSIYHLDKKFSNFSFLIRQLSCLIYRQRNLLYMEVKPGNKYHKVDSLFKGLKKKRHLCIHIRKTDLYSISKMLLFFYTELFCQKIYRSKDFLQKTHSNGATKKISCNNA